MVIILKAPVSSHMQCVAVFNYCACVLPLVAHFTLINFSNSGNSGVPSENPSSETFWDCRLQVEISHVIIERIFSAWPSACPASLLQEPAAERLEKENL